MALVYRYGLLAPTVGADRVRDVMRMAHRLRNTLTEIERGRRDAVRAVEMEAGLFTTSAAYHQADERCAEIGRAIKAHKAAHRTTKILPEQRDALAVAKSERKAAKTALCEATRVLHEAGSPLSERCDDINARALELRRSARAYSGLARSGPLHGAHGTYQLVEVAADKARSAPLHDPVTREPSNPRFRRYDETGTVGVQIQGGTTVPELATHGQIQIVPMARVQSQSPKRNPANIGRARDDSRRARLEPRATLRMRIGSTDSSGRDGIWAEWPMVLGRPLPADALVMAAAVRVRRVGTREEWYLTVSVRVPMERPRCERAGAVAINIGWRRVPTGIRVATWVGEDGGSGEIVVGSSVLERLRHADTIRSLRDELFDIARPWAAAIIAGADAPEWLRHATTTLMSWKSQQRLAQLVHRWKTNRFPGDGAAYEALRAWARRDRHLWQYEAGERANALAHRKNEFRVAAKRLAARYTTLVHDGVDLSRMKRCPMLDADKDNPNARSNMQAAAPGELRTVTIHAFRGDVQTECAVDITHTCPECGRVDVFDAAIKILHRCEGCSALWDQDYAAGSELLARHCERRSAAPDPATARKAEPAENAGQVKESPRAKSKRMARERAERIAARNLVSNAAE